jgi:hypothetical protein
LTSAKVIAAQRDTSIGVRYRPPQSGQIYERLYQESGDFGITATKLLGKHQIFSQNAEGPGDGWPIPTSCSAPLRASAQR